MILPVWILFLATSLVYASSIDQRFLSNSGINTSKFLRVSAVVNADHEPYNAKIECWELNAPFNKYPTVGEALSLGDVTNVTYVTLPPKSHEGLHHPPHNMFFILLSGVAHVRLPTDPDSDGLWIRQGVNPLIVATDTMGLGHYTDYPGDTETVALQVPLKDGQVPEHVVVGNGACECAKQAESKSRRKDIKRLPRVTHESLATRVRQGWNVARSSTGAL